MTDYAIIYDLPELWTDTDRATVRLAAEIVGVALSRYTGLDPVASFNRVIGQTHVRFNNAIQFWAYSSGDKIIFRRGYVVLPLIVHEFGHTFDRRANLRPQQRLIADKINPTAGSLWDGMHTRTMEGGDTPAELWANLFADWSMQMLARNGAGAELRVWMHENMPGWIAESKQMGLFNEEVNDGRTE